VCYAACSWFLGTAGASGTVIDVSYPYHRKALEGYVAEELSNFTGFCAPETSAAMARAARSKAFTCFAQEQGLHAAGLVNFVGVGLTAALATTRERKGKDRCIVALSCSDGSEEVHEIEMVKGESSREEQDHICSLFLVQVLAAKFLGEPIPGAQDLDNVQVVSHKTLAPSAPSIQDWLDGSGPKDPSRAAWLFPGNSGMQVIQDTISTKSVFKTSQVVLLPGSFNPLHHGHTGLAEAAERVLAPLSKDKEIVVAFELSAHNVEKGSISIEAMSERLAQFNSQKHGKWPVVLDVAPRFVDKAELFPTATFVVGYDTAIRIVDPKFYDGSAELMSSALSRMKELGCSFAVAGRLEPATEEFKCLDDMWDSVPDDFREMFSAIDADTFRQDVSSSEIRASKA